MFLVSLASWIFNASNPDLLGVDPFILGWILKMFILISLLICVFAKEKDATERHSKLRLNSLFKAVSVGGFVLIIEFFTEILFQDKKAEISSGYEVMIIILFIYTANFFIKKNLKTVVRD